MRRPYSQPNWNLLRESSIDHEQLVSISTPRNKFQFGCEHGRVIEDGELKHVVKKCNYRGISATFWRNLKGVGTPESVEVMGTPHCGKGEPNQMIRVGHASPTCLFGDVEVFAGD